MYAIKLWNSSVQIPQSDGNIVHKFCPRKRQKFFVGKDEESSRKMSKDATEKTMMEEEKIKSKSGV